MIGVLDMAGQGLVQAAVERSGLSVIALSGLDETLRDVVEGRLEALVLETVSVNAEIRDLLLASRSRGVPTLIVARDRSVSAAVESLRSGATDYLNAPFEYESLLRAVERLLDASSARPAAADEDDVFITQDADMRATLELTRSVAPSDATVLIEGESGTGKELLAQLVHRTSPRRMHELITVNCAALPPGLMESELFGHERGAFTGAFSRVQGKFELAQGSTIMLDEIGELELSLQAKLLRVIQEKQVQRVGARRPIDIDFRLVTTTNRDLNAEVRKGRFREDLYYRLNVLPIRLKPLRERPDDIPLFVDHFLRQQRPASKASPILSAEAFEALRRHDWPGNVRELENLMARLSLTLPGRAIGPEDLDLPNLRLTSWPAQCRSAPRAGTIREMERWLIVEVLTRLKGNRTRAAQELGISLRTLRNKIHDHQINEPETLPQTGGPRIPARESRGRQTSPTRL